MKDDRHRIFPDAHEDIEKTREVPDTPQTRSSAYRLAFADPDFLCRDELRPVRLQLELLKPEMLMTEYGIESTVVLFGPVRVSNRRAGTNAPNPDPASYEPFTSTTRCVDACE